ncbi:MAG: hypothetical protein ABJF09_06140 [Qipengyuania citrea]|uniref:hypothetical protein n=1 Tax=Qipengyuania citrea TaxID=225971 RepID=UPI00326676C4
MAGSKLPKKSRKLITENIFPIVEFFEVDFDDKSEKSFLDLSQEDKCELRSHLIGSKGVYAFYNSEFEIIYVGKTKSNLWNEMKLAFNRSMPHYNRLAVHHPSGRYKATSGGVRVIRPKTLHVYDCATYFSAYRVVDESLIDLLELMLIRICPNDLLNVRIEGNHTLSPHWVD